MNENKSLAFEAIDKVSNVITDLSDAIWDNPETAFLETKSTEIQCEALEKLGFTVEKNLVMFGADNKPTDEFRAMFGDYMDGHQ